MGDRVSGNVGDSDVGADVVGRDVGAFVSPVLVGDGVGDAVGAAHTMPEPLLRVGERGWDASAAGLARTDGMLVSAVRA